VQRQAIGDVSGVGAHEDDGAAPARHDAQADLGEHLSGRGRGGPQNDLDGGPRLAYEASFPTTSTGGAAMSTTTQPTLTPYLTVDGAAELANFYQKAFDATEIARHPAQDGKRLMHLHMKVFGCDLMMSDDFPEMRDGKASTPKALGGTPVTLSLMVPNVDQVWERAVSAGAQVVLPLADQFWGDRYGQVRDPAGHLWALYTPGKKQS
jgi:PhnB protein